VLRKEVGLLVWNVTTVCSSFVTAIAGIQNDTPSASPPNVCDWLTAAVI